jgi:hypothetical protein
MPSANDKVVLEIGLESKKVPKGIKDLQNKFEELGKKLEKINASIVKGFKLQENFLNKIGDAAKKSSAIVESSESKKAAAINKANKALDEQAKKLSRLQTQSSKLGAVAGAAGGIARGIGGGMLAGGSSLMGMVMGAAGNAVGAYSQYGMAQRGLIGTGMTSKQLSRAGGRGVGYGYQMAETAGQAVGIGRETGRGANVTTAQQFGFAGGMGVGEAGGIMGSLYKGGIEFGGRGGKKELAKILQAGVKSGLDQGKMPEFASSVAKMVEQQAARGVGAADASGAAAGLSWLMQGLGTKSPDRALQVAQSLDAGIRTPGGGEAGNAMILQAFGFGKPGGTTDIYEATKRQQQGFFGGKGNQGVKNVQDVLSEFVSQYGEEGVGGKTDSMKMANFMASKVLPLTLEQVEQLQEINNTTESQAEKDEKIKKILADAKPLEEKTKDAMTQGFDDVAKSIAAVNSQLITAGSKFWKVYKDVQKEMLDLFVKMAKPAAKVMETLFEGIKELIANIREIINHIRDLIPNVGGKKSVVTQIGEATTGLHSDMADKIALRWQKKTQGIASKFQPQTAAGTIYQAAAPTMSGLHGQVWGNVGKPGFTYRKAGEKRYRSNIDDIFSRVHKITGMSSEEMQSTKITPKAMALLRRATSPNRTEKEKEGLLTEFGKEFKAGGPLKQVSRTAEQEKLLVELIKKYEGRESEKKSFLRNIQATTKLTTAINENTEYWRQDRATRKINNPKRTAAETSLSKINFMKPLSD